MQATKTKEKEEGKRGAAPGDSQVRPGGPDLRDLDLELLALLLAQLGQRLERLGVLGRREDVVEPLLQDRALGQRPVRVLLLGVESEGGGR
jgi:hypothetical protein